MTPDQPRDPGSAPEHDVARRHAMPRHATPPPRHTTATLRHTTPHSHHTASPLGCCCCCLRSSGLSSELSRERWRLRWGSELRSELSQERPQKEKTFGWELSRRRWSCDYHHHHHPQSHPYPNHDHHHYHGGALSSLEPHSGSDRNAAANSRRRAVVRQVASRSVAAVTVGACGVHPVDFAS